ncbi:MAG: energy transducer TonB [Acidobacteriaceae bacterium]
MARNLLIMLKGMPGFLFPGEGQVKYMGNLAVTNSVLGLGDDRSTKTSSNMGNGVPIPLLLVSKPLGVGQAVPEEQLWRGLASNLRDALFPKKLPPLELASRPISVIDPLAVQRNPVSSMLSFMMHGAMFALFLWFILHAHQQLVAPQHVEVVTPVEFKPFIPITVPAPTTMGGGGGGGAHQVVEASKGHLPPVAKTQVVPVETLKVDHPKLAATPTVEMPKQIKMIPNNTMPNLGDTQSPQIALASQGGGSGAGFGQGRGGGIGSGHGAGIGPGSVGGYGGGVMSVGGGVTAPQVIHRVEPEFSDAARQAKYQGVVSLQLIVDPQGNPQNIQVIHPLGMGLDAKAIEAVRQYRFKPAMYQGHPVPVQILIDVAFHLY